MIRTDVMAIHESYPSADIWVAFGIGDANSLSGNLGRDKSRSLPPFHPFTGCDLPSQFLHNPSDAVVLQ